MLPPRMNLVKKYFLLKNTTEPKSIPSAVAQGHLLLGPPQAVTQFFGECGIQRQQAGQAQFPSRAGELGLSNLSWHCQGPQTAPLLLPTAGQKPARAAWEAPVCRQNLQVA